MTEKQSWSAIAVICVGCAAAFGLLNLFPTEARHDYFPMVFGTLGGGASVVALAIMLRGLLPGVSWVSRVAIFVAGIVGGLVGMAVWIVLMIWVARLITQ